MTSLPELLRVLPLESQQQVLGDSFSSVSACRAVSKELRNICQVIVSHLDLDVGNSADSLAELRCSWQTARSPGALFPLVTRLSLRLPGATLASVQAASMLLRGIAPESRRRITHVALAPAADHECLDYLQLLVTLGEQLPCLQSLELHPHCVDRSSGPDTATTGRGRGWRSSSRSDSGRLLSLLGAVAAFMPGLQRLVLPQLTCPLALPPLGILAAACRQLRELTLTTCQHEVAAPLRLTEAGLAALGRLTALERLTLDCLEVQVGAGRSEEGAWQPPPPPPQQQQQQQQQQQDEEEVGNQGGGGAHDELRPLHLLLGARRPPRMRCLTLQDGFVSSAAASASDWGLSADRLEVSFMPSLITTPQSLPLVGAPEEAIYGWRGAGVAAEEQRRGGWAMSHVLVEPPPRLADWSLEAVARELLAVAEALGQRQLPELVIPQLMVGGVPQGQLLPWQAVALLAARCGRVELGRLVLDRSQGGGEGEGEAPLARAATQVARVLGLPGVVKLKHGDWSCRDLPLQMPPLPLPAPHTASAGQPQQQLDQPEAVEQRPHKRQKLEQQQQQNRQQNSQQQQQQQQQQLLLGSFVPYLPIADPEQVLAAALDRLWVKAGSRDAAGGRSLHLAMRRSSPYTLPAAAVAIAAAHRSLLSQRADCQHVSVPVLGALLLQCDSGVDAAMLARRLSPAAAADGCSVLTATSQQQQQPAVVLRVGVPHAGFNAGSVFKQAVLQVLSDMWTRAAGHQSIGTSSNGNGCGRSASGGDLWGTGTDREAAAVRLGQMVELDRHVWRNWKRLEAHKV